MNTPMLSRSLCIAMAGGTLLTTILFSDVLHAEEGMWTFDNPPVKQLKDQYNFTPTQPGWITCAFPACGLNDGGSGSFVSPHGLLLTNHHVARGQLQKNSTAAARLHSDRLLRGHAGAGDEVAGSGSERPGVDGKRHGSGAGGA